MPISEIRDEVSQGLLGFAWRQWAQVGVSATVEGADQWAVDPEALILFTIGIARRDPRLFDEMLDWMAFNHELLSTQRLRNLAGRFPLPPGLVAAVTAWTRQTAPVNLPVSRPGRPRPGQGAGLQPRCPGIRLEAGSGLRPARLHPSPRREDRQVARAGSGPSGEPVLPASPPIRARRPLRGDASAAHLARRPPRRRPDRRRSRIRQKERQRCPDIPHGLRGHQGRLGRQRTPLHRIPGEMGAAP